MNIIFTVGLVWLYTFRGGVKSLIWTDSIVEELGLEYDEAQQLLLLHGSVKKAVDSYMEIGK